MAKEVKKMMSPEIAYSTFAEYLSIKPEHRNAFIRFCFDLEQVVGKHFVQSFLTTSVIRKRYWFDRLARESDISNANTTDKLFQNRHNVDANRKHLYVFDLQAAIVQILYRPGTVYESLLAEFDVNPSRERVDIVKTLLAKIGTGLILEGKQRSIVSLIARDVYMHVHNVVDNAIDEIIANNYIKVLNNDQFILLSDMSADQLCLRLINFDYAFYVTSLT